MAEVVRGYISIIVEEATGKTQRDQFVWDTNAGAFEAFVKGKLTGQLKDRSLEAGPKCSKVCTELPNKALTFLRFRWLFRLSGNPRRAEEYEGTLYSAILPSILHQLIHQRSFRLP